MTAFESSIPMSIRSLRAILARLQDAPDEPRVGPRIAGWCQREGLAVDAATPRVEAQVAVGGQLVANLKVLWGGLALS